MRVWLAGASAAALQVDVHTGRAGAQRERHPRTVPPSRHMGEPIAAVGRQTLLSHTPRQTPELNWPVTSPTEITLYLLLIVLLSPSSPGVAHYSLSVPSVCACVFVRMGFAFDHPRVLAVSYAGKQDQRTLPESCQRLVF